MSISHQTIINYANRVTLIVKPFIDHFPYELSGSFCGDETYIRVKGRWHYLFFMLDAVKKSYGLIAFRPIEIRCLRFVPWMTS